MNAVSRIASVACTVGLLAAMVQTTPAEQSAPKTAVPQATPSGLPTSTQSARPPEVAALTDAGWPRVITSGQTRITVYQPQIDSYTGYHLAGRAAVAVTEKADAPPINSRTGVAAAGQRGVVGNVYSGNYAAGARGAAVNTNTGAAVAGRTGTVGTAGGREISGGQAVIRGPGGNTTTAGAIRGDQGGAARIGDDVYAGRDGNVYKRNDGGGWDELSRPEPRDRAPADRPQIDRSQVDRDLERQRAGRTNGNNRSGAARSGGFHGGSGGGMRRGGGGGRRR